MNKSNNIIDRFSNIKSWKQGSVRAPHKPLLLLYLLAEFARGNSNFVFSKIENDIRSLLRDFGPNRRSYDVNYPFWRLQNDKLWCVTTDNPVMPNNSGDVGRNILVTENAKGCFPGDVVEKLNADRKILDSIISNLLTQNFPTTVHEDILQAIGYSLISTVETYARRTRCNRFREKVLRAYEYRCAICGFDIRMDNSTIALEAAHIKWHQANGAETENNGLALCALHHKLFDRGAFTLTNEFEILVSDRVHGTQGFSEWLMNYHGKKVCPPQSKNLYPHNENILWHTREVFQGQPRGPSN